MSKAWRKLLPTLLGAAIVFSMLLGVKPSVMYACSCVEPPSPSEAQAQSAVVFSGEAVSLQQKMSDIMSSADPVRVSFQVDRVWKGSVGNIATVTTAASSDSCGYEFAEGRDYLVYARYAPDSGELHTILCDRTALVSEAAADLRELGPPSAPAVRQNASSTLPGAPPPLGPDSSAVHWAVSGLITVVSLSAILLYRWRNPRN
ncbi:hypothetical protein OIN60_04365 [Paenibacillus sp. P96]|uniref:Tissue inhibitor of metalloproteinase n=1 Tax=Paenibacillus zeirhizosphaerae TaxID=2987519 RepID=A0ABT9FN61_9BACL|nr:hypothetical protein [Paenibacillus sp. P96]MDP4096020.1 hypothetical protein [Paenibacillus sp. P96]